MVPPDLVIKAHLKSSKCLRCNVGADLVEKWVDLVECEVDFWQVIERSYG
jgi:hypothetical protein